VLPTPDNNRDQEQERQSKEKLWRRHSVPCDVSPRSYHVGLGLENGAASVRKRDRLT
jgi:hypothetical protein